MDQTSKKSRELSISFIKEQIKVLLGFQTEEAENLMKQGKEFILLFTGSKELSSDEHKNYIDWVNKIKEFRHPTKITS